MSRIFKFKNLTNIRNKLCHNFGNHIKPIQACNFSTQKAETPKEGPDEPVSYLNSEAAKWPARYSRTLATDERLWYQPLVIVFSVTSMLIYFCVLREENDIDAMLSQSLDSTIPGIEEQNFRFSEQTKNKA